MKHKMMISILIISIVLAFECTLNVFAESQILQNVNFHYSPLQADLMKFEMMPTSIALNESGFAAVSYNRGNYRFVVLFCPDGTIKQYSFQTSGSYVLDMDENRLMVYLVRSDLKISLNLYSEDVSAQKCDTNQVDKIYASLKGLERIEAGNNVLRAIVEHGHYSLYLNEKLILQTTTAALVVHYLGYFLPFAVMIVGMLMFYYRTKQYVSQRDSRNYYAGQGDGSSV